MKRPQEAGAIRDVYDGADNRHSTNSESPQQYRVTCSEFRAFSKNTLQGFATLRLEPPGIEIQGCSVHAKGDKRWLNFPSKQYTNPDGVICWQNLITIDEGSAYWRFQGLALAAIDDYLGQPGIEVRKEGNANALPF